MAAVNDGDGDGDSDNESSTTTATATSNDDGDADPLSTESSSSSSSKQKRRRRNGRVKSKKKTRIPEECHQAMRQYLRNLKSFNERAKEGDRYPLLKFAPIQQKPRKKKKLGAGRPPPPLPPQMTVYRFQIDQWIEEMSKFVQTQHAISDFNWFRFIPCGKFNPAVKITLMGKVAAGNVVYLRKRPEDGYSAMYAEESEGATADGSGLVQLESHVAYCDVFFSVSFLVMLRTAEGAEHVLFDLHPRAERSRIREYEDCKLVLSNQNSRGIDLLQFHADNWLAISLIYRHTHGPDSVL